MRSHRIFLLVALASCSLWYSAAALTLVLHEALHALAGYLGGGQVTGFSLEWIFPRGTTYCSYPFLEIPAAVRIACTAGGFGGEVLLGMALLLTWVLYRPARNSLFWIHLVYATAGTTVYMVFFWALAADASHRNDVRSLMTDLAVPETAARRALGILGGLCLCALVYWGYRAFSHWCSRYLPTWTRGERFLGLLAAAWIPYFVLTPVLYAIWRLTSAGYSMGLESLVLFIPLLIIALLTLPLLAWVSGYGRRTRRPPVPGRDGSPPVRRVTTGAVIAAAGLAVISAALVVAVDRIWSHDRQVDPEEIERRVARDPDDPRILRLAAWHYRNLGLQAPEEDCLVRALRAAPDDAGILADLAHLHLLKERLDEALEEIDRAAALRPDVAGIAGRQAKILEELGRYGAAAKAWRRYAATIDHDAVPQSVPRHRRMALARARALERMSRQQQSSSGSTDEAEGFRRRE